MTFNDESGGERWGAYGVRCDGPPRDDAWGQRDELMGMIQRRRERNVRGGNTIEVPGIQMQCARQIMLMELVIQLVRQCAAGDECDGQCKQGGGDVGF